MGPTLAACQGLTQQYGRSLGVENLSSLSESFRSLSLPKFVGLGVPGQYRPPPTRMKLQCHRALSRPLGRSSFAGRSVPFEGNAEVCPRGVLFQPCPSPYLYTASTCVQRWTLSQQGFETRTYKDDGFGGRWYSSMFLFRAL